MAVMVPIMYTHGLHSGHYSGWGATPRGEAGDHLHVRHTTWGSCKIQFGYAQKISNNFLKIQNTEAGACPTDAATKGRNNKQKRQKARNIIEWRPWRMWVRVKGQTSSEGDSKPRRSVMARAGKWPENALFSSH